MWCGLTQSVPLWHSIDFSRRSPSVLSSGMALNRITMTKSSLHTLSACLKQSMRLILPFWSGFDRTHVGALFPVILNTKSSRYSCLMSFLNLASSLEAHFDFTSCFSFYKQNYKMTNTRNDQLVRPLRRVSRGERSGASFEGISCSVVIQPSLRMGRGSSRLTHTSTQLISE